MLFLLAAVFGAATQAQAQAPTCGTNSIWCATLTMGSTSSASHTVSVATSTPIGWSSTRKAMTGDSHTYGDAAGQDENEMTFAPGSVGGVFLIGYSSVDGGSLLIRYFSGDGSNWLDTEANRDSMTFKVGSEFFDFEDGAWNTAENDLIWTNIGTRLTWASGTVVTVSIETKSTGDDATLSGLSLDEGVNSITLSPAFSSNVTSYTASVLYRVASSTLTAMPRNSGATVTISPTDAGRGRDNHQLNLEVGSNAITVTVVHGSTTGAYTVTVTRAAGSDPAVPTCATDAIWCATLVAGSSSTSPTLFGWRAFHGLFFGFVNSDITYGAGYTRTVIFDRSGIVHAGVLDAFESDNAGNGTLKMVFDRTSGEWLRIAANRNSLSLQVGNRTFDFADGDWVDTAAERSLTWTNVGFSWSAGTVVTVHIVKEDLGTPAAGSVTITGPPQVGQTLTADTSGITDADGLTSPGYTYRWTRVDGMNETNLSSGSTYAVTTADVGKQLKVRVDFTDDENNPETKTSEATAPVVTAVRSSCNKSMIPSTVWCATLTSGSDTSRVGYVSDSSPALGSLSGGNTFDFEGVTYTVTRLYARQNSIDGEFRFAVSPALPDAQGKARLILHIEKMSGEASFGLGLSGYGVLGTNHVEFLLRLGDFAHDLKLRGQFTSPDLAATADGVRVAVRLSVKPAVSFGSSSYTATESGSSAQVEVRMDPAPSATAVIPITKTNEDGAVDADYSGVPSSVTFTAGQTSRTFTVSATDDSDSDDESVRLAFGDLPPGKVVKGSPDETVVNLTDNDRPSEAVLLSVTPDTVSEGAGASTLTVTGMLDASARVDAMEVELTIPSGDGYTAVGGTLTIAAGAVSGTARLTLTPEDDNADLEDFPVTVEATTTAQATLTSGTMQPMRLEPGTLTVTIEDDDERGMTVTPTALTVAEGGSGEYTVVLHSEPDGGAVAVTLSLSDDANTATDASVMPASLTFQASDWGTAQTVTVTVPEDLGAVEADATATIAHAVLGADYGSNNVAAAAVTVTVPGYELTEAGDGVLLLVSGGVAMIPSGTPAPAGLSLAFPAAHDGQTVTVRTAPAPGDDPRGFSLGDTVVDISGVELGSGETATVCLPASAGGELSVQRWDEANQVWVELDEPPGGSPSGRVCGVTGQFSMFAVMVRLEEPELVFSADALTVTIGEEEGATYTVALGLEPAGAVTVTVSGHEGTELSVAPATLVFTEGDWNVAQAVTATVSDEAEAGSEAVLTHTASGGRYLGDWEKTLAVTVERDSGLLQRAREAWLARFGRTAAGHVAEAVAERLAAPAGQETQLALGGAQPRQALVAGVLQTLAGESRPDGRRMLADSAFVLALGSDGEQSWTAWGRGAYTEFDGEEEGLELDGEVASGTLGVDVERGDWRLGLALSHSEGEGEIREAEGDRYELESSLTGAYPYARWQLDETLSVWGVLGWGEGELEQERDGERTETDLEMRMAAFGARGGLGGVEFGSGTFELSLKSDLLAVRVEADADEDEDLPEVEADAQRVRVLLEGAGHCPLESGGVLAPTLEAGLRYDEGDAETGLGAELGAGLRYADGSGRLSAELNARGLLAHEESGYEEWGVSGSLRLEPDGSGRGLSLTLESALGATGSGADELWARRDLSGLARDDDFEAAGRLRAEMGLGLNAPGGLGTMTPYVGYGRTDSESIWHLGGRLKAGPDLAIGLEGSMHRGGGDSDRQELRLNLSGRW